MATQTAQQGWTRESWARSFLAYAGFPVTSQNIRAIVIWESAEGTKAQNNPLATTEPSPGATDFNSVGVKNYASAQAGLEATRKTLYGSASGYAAIRQALTHGNSALATVTAIGHSVWGTSLATLLSIFHANTNYGAHPVNVSGKATDAIQSSPSATIPGVGAVTGAISSITSAADAIKWVFENPLRILYVLGGGILAVIALIQLARRLGGSAVGREVAGAARVAT